MRVLSLFDGLSGGRIALERAGIFVEKYYASEVDKYAMAVSRYNYPDNIFIGDVRGVNTDELGNIDILIGGSPCTDFSFAGKREGAVTEENIEVTSLNQYLYLKSQDFAFKGQSYLIWEYVRILRELQKKNPNVLFMLENVKMKKKWEDIITKTLGVEPLKFNSALVSAQNRERLYWTNIKNVKPPFDLGIKLKDILDWENIDAKLDLRGKNIEFKSFKENSVCHHIANIDIKGNQSIKRVYGILGKAPALTTMRGGHREPKVFYSKEQEGLFLSKKNIEFMEGSFGGKPRWVKFPNVLERKAGSVLRTMSKGLPRGVLKIDIDYYKRFYNIDELNKLKNMPFFKDRYVWRKLSPLECERLQTIEDNYTAIGVFEDGKEKPISKTQRYSMVGNGWTIDMVAHIFKHIKEGKEA